MKNLLLFFFLSAVEVFGLSTNQLDYLTGNAGGLTNLPDAALSANVALLNANQTFTGNETFSGTVNASTLVVTQFLNSMAAFAGATNNYDLSKSAQYYLANTPCAITGFLSTGGLSALQQPKSRLVITNASTTNITLTITTPIFANGAAISSTTAWTLTNATVRGFDFYASTNTAQTAYTNVVAEPVTAAAGGGSQTPWTSDINGAGFSLTNSLGITNTANIQTASLNLTGTIPIPIKLPSPLNQNTAQIAGGGDNTGINFRGSGNNEVGIVLAGAIVAQFGNNNDLRIASDGTFGFSPTGFGTGWLAVNDAFFSRSAAGTMKLSTNLIAVGTVTATNGVATFNNNKAAPTTITVGASPFSYTNTGTVDGRLVIDGATAFSATWNATTVQSSLAGGLTLILQPGEWSTVTYTVAPGMFFK